MCKRVHQAVLVYGLLAASGVAALAEDRPLTDPTRPYDQPVVSDPVTGQVVEQEVPLPVLQAVFAQGEKHSALLDGQRVYSGDQIGPYQVVAIQAGQVVLEQNEQQTVLKIGLAEVKRRASEDVR